MDYRVILYHKHPTSARTRFLLFHYQSVCYPEPLPEPSRLSGGQVGNWVLHPAAILKQVETDLGLTPDILAAESGFQHRVTISGGVIQAILARIDGIDPPADAVDRIGARFIDLTQARGLPSIELQLLRHAYELILGG